MEGLIIDLLVFYRDMLIASISILVWGKMGFLFLYHGVFSHDVGPTTLQYVFMFYLLFGSFVSVSLWCNVAWWATGQARFVGSRLVAVGGERNYRLQIDLLQNVGPCPVALRRPASAL